MFALMLRRAGHNVRYLGADVPLADLVKSIQALQPRVVVLAAALAQSAARLEELPRLLKEAGQHVYLVLGGHAFSADPSLRERLHGDYTGTDLSEGVVAVTRLLSAGQAGSFTPGA